MYNEYDNLQRGVPMKTQEFWSKINAEPFGKAACEPLNCGAGLAIENENGSDEDSYMLVLDGVTAVDFRAFLSEMAANGKKETFHREFNGNIFVEFASDGEIIYTYFTFEKRQARIIIDNSSSPLSEMSDTRDDVRGDTQLMQFSLRYGEMIRFHSCNCGMLYALRLRDNSVIVVDGGEMEQATEDACDEFMARLEDMTNTEKGGKIRVAAWLCTHNHDDHMDVFVKILKREHERLEVERVLYNFPSKTLQFYDNPCTDRMKSRMAEYAPNVKYLKLHTGQTIKFPDAMLEVLTTHEDILPRSTRAGEGKTYRGVNEGTSVVKITFDDCSVIFLGDAEETNGEELIALYGKRSLFCTYLQCAHHTLNDDRNIYSNIRAKKLLIPQCRYNSIKYERENNKYFTELFGAENLYFAGDCTQIFTVKDGEESIELFAQRGYDYDGSEY